MFSIFKRKDNLVESNDKVWKTSQAALKGLLMIALMRVQQGKPALIVCFFESEVEELQAFLKQNELECVIIDESSATEVISNAVICLVSESSVYSSLVSDLLKKSKDEFGKGVLFPGHYPMIDYENKLLMKLKELGYDSFNFCLSFDDPMMKAFKTGNILPLLERLGLEENEAIEHGMVSKSILNARKKINEKVKIEQKAKSPEEWFKLNVKS